MLKRFRISGLVVYHSSSQQVAMKAKHIVRILRGALIASPFYLRYYASLKDKVEQLQDGSNFALKE